MRVILSRKGFDSSYGKAPSPIVDGRPVSLPIPTGHRSETSFADLGLGDMVERVTKGRISGSHLCHDDPMFFDGQCLFGQCGAAQGHLRNRNVGVGDVFLFFGLFADEMTHERHHRIFGYLKVEKIFSPPLPEKIGPPGRRHPHTIGAWNPNNTIYRGTGRTARHAHDILRLTQAGGPLLCWNIPEWLRRTGLSYHPNAENWSVPGKLQAASRGQEFIADIGEDGDAKAWIDEVVEAIEE